jgi:hypothetical protein
VGLGVVVNKFDNTADPCVVVLETELEDYFKLGILLSKGVGDANVEKVDSSEMAK